MNKLERYQNYANKCADKLEIEHPVLRWSGGDCKVKKNYHAHCHVMWHHCVAHEVAHLAVKSTHGTPTFDRRLVQLGVANYSERQNARSAKKGHHHIWSILGRDSQGYYRECRVCQKREY